MNNKLPPFGDLLNAGIQTIKNLSNRNRISQNVFLGNVKVSLVFMQNIKI